MIGMTFRQKGISVPEVLIYPCISERLQNLHAFVLLIWPGICIIQRQECQRFLRNNIIAYEIILALVLLFYEIQFLKTGC
jgi:hypothetical protein